MAFVVATPLPRPIREKEPRILGIKEEIKDLLAGEQKPSGAKREVPK
jgi:hypothetical protein